MEYPGATESKHHKPILLPPENTIAPLPAVLPGDPLQTLPEDKHFQSLTSDPTVTSSSQQYSITGTCSQTLLPKWLRFALSSILTSHFCCVLVQNSELCSVGASPASAEGMCGSSRLPDENTAAQRCRGTTWIPDEAQEQRTFASDTKRRQKRRIREIS